MQTVCYDVSVSTEKETDADMMSDGRAQSERDLVSHKLELVMKIEQNREWIMQLREPSAKTRDYFDHLGFSCYQTTRIKRAHNDLTMSAISYHRLHC